MVTELQTLISLGIFMRDFSRVLFQSEGNGKHWSVSMDRCRKLVGIAQQVPVSRGGSLAYPRSFKVFNQPHLDRCMHSCQALTLARSSVLSLFTPLRPITRRCVRLLHRANTPSRSEKCTCVLRISCRLALTTLIFAARCSMT